MEKRKITIAVLLITTLWVDQCFATFTYFSTHPYANQLPTQEVGPNGTVRNCYGRSLWTLIEYQSSLYAGYGDWQCNNSTPIHICSLTPPSTTHVCELVFHNDAVETFRIYNNKLFAVGIDPSPETGAWGNYAVKQNGVWSEITYFLVNNTIRPSHNFDIVEYSGAIWLLGNQWNTDGTSTQHATAWKSINNGALDSWTIGKSSPIAEFSNYHFGVIYKNKMYIQLGAGNSGYRDYLHPQSLIYDGSTWSDGPSLYPFIQSEGVKASVYDDSIVLIWDNYLAAFDGSSVSYVSEYAVTDYTVENGYIYTLRSGDKSIYRANQLYGSGWIKVDSAPYNAISIEVLNGAVYVGTTDSKIYKSDVDLSLLPDRQPVTTPSNYLLILD